MNMEESSASNKLAKKMTGEVQLKNASIGNTKRNKAAKWLVTSKSTVFQVISISHLIHTAIF